MAMFVADFETTTDKNDCRVWAFAICEVGNIDNIIIGNNIDDFMNFCKKRGNHKIFFHNLKFDVQFIISWLFKNGYRHTTEQADRKTKTFNTLINQKGLYYQLEVIFERKGKNINKVTFQDSLKLIPLSVEEIAKTFDFHFKKLKIDYNKKRNENHILTDSEISYIENDVKIVAKAIEFFYKNGLNKMTIGASALNEFKKTITNKNFLRWFPSPYYDNDVRQSYFGGWTFLNPKYAEKTVKNGFVLDVNSIYPFVMKNEKMSYGTPIFFRGKYKTDKYYPIYVQMIRCQFELKNGKLPTIQIRRMGLPNQYLTNSGNTEITMCLTSVDLNLFFENYDIYNLEYVSGWKFKATTGIFDEYIDKCYQEKVKAKAENNGGLYLISKLRLNSLYGKFGTLTQYKNKIPYLDKNGVINYKCSEIKSKDGVYIPLATFVTAYARQYIINSAQKIVDDYNSGKSNIEFIYADTDSLHCISPDGELPKDIIIDDIELGAFKFEGDFKRAKFIRPKCYIEELRKPGEQNYNLKITVAGMPNSCYEKVNFKNFKVGATYSGKLEPIQVPNGVILQDVDFTIKKV